MLVLIPPVLEFRILCLGGGGAVSSYSSHHPQEVLLAQLSLYLHKAGLKPHAYNLYEHAECSIMNLATGSKTGAKPIHDT